MQAFDAIVLGITQGVTEFLPVSSDGHLVVIHRFLGIQEAGRDALGFDILLHCGSLLAILVGFRDVWTRLVRGLLARERTAWRTAGLIVIATIPGAVAGLLFQDAVSDMRSLTAAAAGFLVTAAFLVGGEWIGRMRREHEMSGIASAILMGLAQAAAILPGVSRSGLTVGTARALGIGRSAALDFSFLMALPIIGGAVAKTALDVADGSVAFPAFAVSLSGFVASAFVSLCAILFLRRFVKRNSFAWFAWYLIPLALLLLSEDAGFRAFFEASHAKEVVRTWGAWPVFAFAFVEVIPPFSIVSPGISALVIAGSLAPDAPSLFTFILAAVAASFIGNIVLYVAGHFTGPALERAIRLSPAHRMKAEAFVRRLGAWAVVGGQFTSIMRPTVAFIAGVLRMPWYRFCGAAFLGAVLWGSSALVAGYVLRENIELVISTVVAVGVIAALGIGIAALIRWRHIRSDS